MLRKILHCDEQGTAAVELALIAPALAVMTIGIVDISNAYSRKLALEQGAQRAIEKIMQTTDDDTVESTLKTEAVCQVNGQNSNGSCKTTPITTSNVTVTYKLLCRDGGGAIGSTQTNTDPAVFDTYTCPSSSPKETRYIEVSINDSYQGIFLTNFVGRSDGTYPISAVAGMRTQ